MAKNEDKNTESVDTVNSTTATTPEQQSPKKKYVKLISSANYPITLDYDDNEHIVLAANGHIDYVDYDKLHKPLPNKVFIIDL